MKPLGGLLILVGITATTAACFCVSWSLGFFMLGGWCLVLGVGMAQQ